MAMATSVCLPSPLATGATATSHSARLARRLRRPHPLSRAAAGMDALHVSSRDTEPLLHAAAAAANATHRRLRVRTHAQGAEDVSTGAGDGAAAAEAGYSLAAIILPFVFPALGGLLFGYDIGATSGATISVHSAALSGTTWFGLSSVQLGLVFGYLVGSLEIDVVGGWRYMFGLSAPLAAIMAVGMWTLPPSPRWLLLRAVQGKSPVEDNKKKAIQALRRLKGRSASDKVLTDEVDSNLSSIRAAYADQESEGSIFQVFEGASLKAFTIGGGLVLFQQTAGFSAASDAAKVSILIGLFKFLMTGFAVFKVDDLGRRPLLIGGVSGITIALLLLAAYYKILSGFPYVAVGALLLYVGSYQVSFGPISWLMVSEIFPLRTRGRGISLAVLTNFGSNALVTFAFSPLQGYLGPANIFLLFAAISVLALVFVILNVPETKGLSLEDIESKILK